jgi:acetylornithine/succinyldiaminopimelate/putrescine aminotransferase
MAALELLPPALLAQVAETGRVLRAELTAALAGNPLFDHVRGDGLAIGIVLRAADHPWMTFDHFGHSPTTGVLLCHQLYRRGFFAVVCGHDWRVVRMLPRLSITAPRARELVAAVREALAMLADASDAARSA